MNLHLCDHGHITSLGLPSSTIWKGVTNLYAMPLPTVIFYDSQRTKMLRRKQELKGRVEAKVL